MFELNDRVHLIIGPDWPGTIIAPVNVDNRYWVEWDYDGIVTHHHEGLIRKITPEQDKAYAIDMKQHKLLYAGV